MQRFSYFYSTRHGATPTVLIELIAISILLHCHRNFERKQNDAKRRAVMFPGLTLQHRANIECFTVAGGKANVICDNWKRK